MTDQAAKNIAELYAQYGNSSKPAENPAQGIIYFNPMGILLPVVPFGHTHSVAR